MAPVTFRLLALALLTIAAGASAQNSPASELVPGLDRFDLAPRAQPSTPRAEPAPAPRATPTRAPAPRPTRAPVARPTATPTPAAARDPIPIDTPASLPAPAPPLPTPTATAEPLPILPVPVATTVPAPSSVALDPPAADATPPAPVAASDTNAWPWALGAFAALLALAAGLWVYRRRKSADRFTLDVDQIATRDETLPADRPLPDMPHAEDFPPASPRQPDAPPSPAPVFLADVPHAAPRAMLELTVRPIRAGTNLTSAAVDYEIDIRNSGELDATDIRLDLRLLSASADQDALLTALYAAPIDKPIIAPFQITAGEQVSLGGMAMLPRELLSVMTAQGRDFFVPLLSVNLVYGWDGAETGQTASAHVVGIERAGGGKMAPFRLDSGPRMHDGVGAREHTLTVRH